MGNRRCPAGPESGPSRPREAEDRPWGLPSGPAGRAHLPARLHLLSVAGPSLRVNSLGLRGNHAGGRPRASGLTGTAREGGEGWARWREGVVPGRLGAGTCAWPPLPPLISCGERAPGEGSPGLGLGAPPPASNPSFVSSGLRPGPSSVSGAFQMKLLNWLILGNPRIPAAVVRASVWVCTACPPNVCAYSQRSLPTAASDLLFHQPATPRPHPKPSCNYICSRLDPPDRSCFG